MSIKDMPITERPREKALIKGVETLSDSELLAIILQSGTCKESVLELSSKLIVNFKGLHNLFNTPLEKLVEIEGINKVKAIQLLTIKELFNRFQMVSITNNELYFKSVDDVYYYAYNKFANKTNECLLAFYLNNQNKLIFEEIITIGNDISTLTNNKRICKTAIEKYAKKVIIAHNHPSGNAYPSYEDISNFYKLKGSLKNIEVKLIDHLIVSQNQYYSLEKENMYYVNNS